MRKNLTLVALMAALIWVVNSPVAAAGNGSNGGRAGKGSAASGQRAGGSGQRYGQAEDRTPPGKQAGDLDRQRQRIHVPSGQSAGFHSCTDAAQQARSQAKTMAKAGNSNSVSSSTLQQQRQKLGESVGSMLHRHLSWAL